MRSVTATITLPTLWASAIINNDWSSLTEEETNHLKDFYERNPHIGGALCVGEAYTGRHLGAVTEVAAYTFSVRQGRLQDRLQDRLQGETCAY